jgi:hypothetical protein
VSPCDEGLRIPDHAPRADWTDPAPEDTDDGLDPARGILLALALSVGAPLLLHLAMR